MNSEVKKKWVEALRSGEYQQCKRALHTNEGYCCLGVLCDLYARETGKGRWESLELSSMKKFCTESNPYELELLPTAVQSWAGVNSNPSVKENELDGWNTTLTSLNDSGRSFAEIANLIEEKL